MDEWVLILSLTAVVNQAIICPYTCMIKDDTVTRQRHSQFFNFVHTELTSSLLDGTHIS